MAIWGQTLGASGEEGSMRTLAIDRRTRAAAALLVILASGCFPPPNYRPPFEEVLKKLVSPTPEEFEPTFQMLIQAGPAAQPLLKAALPTIERRGFPIVALLYVQGEGDAVPLDLRARHLAAFVWPRAYRVDNAILEPYAWNELEHDLVQAGRPALRFLADALAAEAPTEEKALHVVRVMLRIGGRAAAEQFARLLEVERDLGGVRVCDVAAGALLYLGRQELALREARRAALAEAARVWWAKAKDQTEAEWVRASAAVLAERWQPKDIEGVRGPFELLVGETVEDPKEWWAKHPDWGPQGEALHPEALLPLFSAGRPQAYFANGQLERATGVRVALPRMERLSELCAALRLWQPSPDLPVRWKRCLESPLLRLSITAVGYHPKREVNHVLWTHETHFPPGEDGTAQLRLGEARESYLLWVQSRDFGTRLFLGEYDNSDDAQRGSTSEFSALRPLILFSAPLKAAVVVTVEEASARRPLRPVDLVLAEVRRRLKKLAEGPEGEESRKALRALAYLQEGTDLELFKSRRAGEALLMLGDPSALELQPTLEPHEIEMALRKAEDPKVREYLQDLRRRTAETRRR